tara:strand:+ start:717 stop:2081 length:1365 start_codon:yes stop_codon:yes gene_type:complete
MNKIKQNKITFTLILTAIVIIFSSFTVLSLPVLFNYKSKVALIEKNFYKNFKIYLKSKEKISYKPFPRPHLLVEKASLNFNKTTKYKNSINTSNLKIYISLRNIYLRSFSKFVSTEISDTNINLKITDIKELRNHLYKKINKPIILNNCKIFLRNKKSEVILISPLKKIKYKINEKSKTKNLDIFGKVFGLDFKSEWKRNYLTPKNSSHSINIYNPNLDIKNNFEFNEVNNFKGQSDITYYQDKMQYNIQFENNIINISSQISKKTNFNINSKIQLNPFYFDGQLLIKNKKIEDLVDTLLFYLLIYNEKYLGNLNGNLKIKFDKLKNKLIKNGQIDFIFSEKKIILNKAKFKLDKIGNIETEISSFEDNGEIKFLFNNHLNIDNHIEFAKTFQIGSKKIKKIKNISFDIIKSFRQKDLIITNIRLNDKRNLKSEQIFIVNNIQNLRSHIRKVID